MLVYRQKFPPLSFFAPGRIESPFLFCYGIVSFRPIWGSSPFFSSETRYSRNADMPYETKRSMHYLTLIGGRLESYG